MRLRITNRLLWLAVLGGPAAWAAQFVVNLYVTWAQCNSPAGRYQIPVHGIQIGLSAAAVTVCLGCLALSAVMYRRTYSLDHEAIAAEERKGEGTQPPTGRISFLSMVGLTVNFLSLAIIVMTAIAAPLLPVCQQS